MKIDILKTDGQKTGRSIELPEGIFGIEPNEHVVWLAVKAFQAAQRQGTHKTKDRSEVNGSTKKLKKQKGTGGARAGSAKSATRKGGATFFGPKPHDYDMKINKKTQDLARKSALVMRAKDNALTVVEDFQLEDFKTKNYTSILKNLGLATAKSTLLVSGADSNLKIASRNLVRNSVVEVKNMNIWNIMNGGKLVFTESGIKALDENSKN